LRPTYINWHDARLSLFWAALPTMKVREALIKSVTPAQAGVQLVDIPGFRLSPE
jgi:hypothetical protein